MSKEEQKTIFLVDDNMANLTQGKAMLKDSYAVIPLPSAETMFELLKNVTPDLILLDVDMPDMNGYEAIKKLKAQSKWEQIPVIFLTSKNDQRSEMEGLSLGAVDYVGKPFSAPLLCKRIENHLIIEEQKNQLKQSNESLFADILKKNEELLKMQNAILCTIANLVEFNNDVTGSHIVRVMRYLELLLNEVIESGVYADETSKWDLKLALPSAQLHDVGKIGIPSPILNKPDKLTPEEFEEMKNHVQIGVKAIKSIAENAGNHLFLRHALLFAGGHHEKWDGTGYPLGRSGMDIPLEGRLLAIADVYDALTSKRPYKKTLGTADAYRVIAEGAGTHFDPVLVEMFQRVADGFANLAKEASY